ncbi:MAG: hypothetical protein GTO62_00885, partial [Planctomycetales bacterium]|nr:hypothetical protein [Planctomycetales bacterium]NIP67776.1 hypothetical protein [Planctomycetales bacterium]
MREELPVIRVTPSTLYDVLKEWLTCRRHQWTELAGRSRQYVERWHDPLAIARRLRSDYEAIMAEKQRGSKISQKLPPKNL